MVLIAVLVVVVVLSLLAYQYADLMLTEYAAADGVVKAAQARALADSGIQYVAALLSQPDAMNNVLGGNPFDNPQCFEAQPLFPGGTVNPLGRFSLIAPVPGGGQGLTYGIVDESSKINLNAMMRLDPSGEKLYQLLLKLPAMTEDSAAAIVDWLDEDDEPRIGGAESDSYSSFAIPYRCKNGPLDSLEELLLVQGVTPELLFGSDFNRNGILDLGEPSVDPLLDLGWSAYLTIYSREQNLDSTFQPRINLNEKDLNMLSQQLNVAIDQQLASYILLYRIYGGQSQSGGSSGGGGSSSGNGSSGGSSGSGSSGSGSSGNSGSSSSGSGPATTTIPEGALDLNQEGKNTIKSIFDLVNSQVVIPGKNGTPSTTVASPLNNPQMLSQLFGPLVDKTTAAKDAEIPARINIHTAPQAVLATLPGLDETQVQQIVSSRPGTGNQTSEAYSWLMADAGLSAATLKKLEPYITGCSQVYRVQAIGYFQGGGPSARIEAVIDANAGRPRILYRRDLSVMGRGIAP